MIRWQTILVVIIIIYFSFTFRADWLKYSELKKEYGRLSNKITEEKKLIVSLRKELRALKTDSYIEGVARKKLGLIKKGETAYKAIRR